MKKMLKVLAIVMIAGLLLVSCGGKSGTGDSASSSKGGEVELLTKVLKDGKITVALNLANAPFSYKETDSGKIAGMAADLIEGFANGIGVKVEYLTLEFPGLIPAIQSGKADIICMNLSRTIPRAAQVLFTEPVGSAPGVAVIRKGSFKNFDEINKKGVILTTEAGTVHEEIAASVFPNATMKAVPQNADAMAALKSGRADVFATGMDVAVSMKEKDPGIDYLPEFVFTDSFAFAVALSKNSFTFWEAFNNYMRLIKLDGTYGEIYKKYFDATWVPVLVEEGL